MSTPKCSRWHPTSGRRSAPSGWPTPSPRRSSAGGCVPTVFAPTLPAGLDLSRLHGVLVGVQDGAGRCLGLGVLEFSEDVLRVITNVGGGMQGLRLGSLRIDLSDFASKQINLQEMIFGLES